MTVKTSIHVGGGDAGRLAEYSRIPIAFAVTEVLDVVGDDPFTLVPRTVAAPYVKDYDAANLEPIGSWTQRFQALKHALIVARDDGTLVGGALVVYDSPDVDLLEGRSDLAVLWDLRILPARRRQGVGSVVFETAERWAADRGCLELKVETQNINVPACRFYAQRGCVLRRVHRHAYAEFPDEIQLLWYKNLARNRSRPSRLVC